MERKIMNYIKHYENNEVKVDDAQIYKILDKYIKIAKENDIKIKFATSRISNQDNLNSNAGLFKRSKVVFNSKWAAICFWGDSKFIQDMFLTTLLHEKSHKLNDTYIVSFNKETIRFVAWINEVKADLYSFVNSKFSKQYYLEFLQYKTKDKNKQDHDFYHPSWSYRFYILEKYCVFNEEVIRNIANELNYNKEKVINKIFQKG